MQIFSMNICVLLAASPVMNRKILWALMMGQWSRGKIKVFGYWKIRLGKGTGERNKLQPRIYLIQMYFQTFFKIYNLILT